MWGKPRLPFVPVFSWRFTPTLVGKTNGGRSAQLCSSVHPHACGENAGIPVDVAAVDGSPPRLWGKRDLPITVRGIVRFTPTLVGKTRSIWMTMRMAKVHPHACGENDMHTWQSSGFDGSPPRLWGKPSPSKQHSRRNRFTPTLVGKTLKKSSLCSWTTVHPHACGENPQFRRQIVKQNGSPPRLWGKRQQAGFPIRPYRFTPTLVGKTSTRTVRRPSWPVHPHACGENFDPHRSQTQLAGSPPRLWGKRFLRRLFRLFRRFTPTLVGKTAYVNVITTKISVHPHACGENDPVVHRRRRVQGSPPRLWGKRTRFFLAFQRRRFTPTLVGKTLT